MCIRDRSCSDVGSSVCFDDPHAWSFAKLAFRLEMSGAINLFVTDGMPDLAAGDGSNLDISVFGSLAFEWTATSSELKEVAMVAHVAFTQGDADDPTVRVTGTAAFAWPCVPGAAIAFPATVDVRMGAFIVEGGAGDTSLACGTKAQRAGAPKAAVSVAIGRVTVHGVLLTGVIVHAELFLSLIHI